MSVWWINQGGDFLAAPANCGSVSLEYCHLKWSSQEQIDKDNECFIKTYCTGPYGHMQVQETVHKLNRSLGGQEDIEGLADFPCITS